MNVPPSRSSCRSLPSRARPTRSARAAAISAIERRSRRWITGTTSPCRHRDGDADVRARDAARSRRRCRERSRRGGACSADRADLREEVGDRRPDAVARALDELLAQRRSRALMSAVTSRSGTRAPARPRSAGARSSCASTTSSASARTSPAGASCRRAGGSRRGRRGALDVLGDDAALGAGAAATQRRSMPRSRAIRRASGDALTRPSRRASPQPRSGVERSLRLARAPALGAFAAPRRRCPASAARRRRRHRHLFALLADERRSSGRPGPRPPRRRSSAARRRRRPRPPA